MGALVSVGISHHAAPIAIRERLVIDEARWRSLAQPSVLLSTCNRVELYAWTDGRPSTTRRRLERGLARAAGLPLDELRPYLSTYVGREALLHLVRVAAGLDSLIVGEDQIRAQVRDALRAAEATWLLPAPLRGVFQRAAESARRVRSGTRLGGLPSIAAASVHVAARCLPRGLAGQCAVVLGAGVVARSAVESLLLQRAHVQVLNRTPAHAARVFGHLGNRVRIGDLETALPAALEAAAVVIGATASPQPVVRLETVQAALNSRHGHDLLLVDIAVPRDIDPQVRALPGARLIDLDDLERECPLDAGARRAELEHAEALANQEADRLMAWLRHRAAGPAITELREYAERIRAAELRRSAARLKDLTPEQIAAVEALTTGIVNKLLHGPTLALRDAAARPAGLTRSRSRILRVVRPAHGRSTA